MSEVGVVIRTFDAARYLAASLESVIAQTRPPAEIVAVDGGSTDGTLEILASFGDRVRVVAQRRRGLAALAGRRRRDQASHGGVSGCRRSLAAIGWRRWSEGSNRTTSGMGSWDASSTSCRRNSPRGRRSIRDSGRSAARPDCLRFSFDVRSSIVRASSSTGSRRASTSSGSIGRPADVRIEPVETILPSAPRASAQLHPPPRVEAGLSSRGAGGDGPPSRRRRSGYSLRIRRSSQIDPVHGSMFPLRHAGFAVHLGRHSAPRGRAIHRRGDRVGACPRRSAAR